MTLPNFIALFAVQQDVSDLEAQLSLYGNIDYVIDREADLVEGAELPKEWFTARGVQPEDFYAVRAIRLLGDPYMHIWMYSLEWSCDRCPMAAKVQPNRLPGDDLTI
ncbi:hypothetical protein LTR13_011353 [Exophiala sideris]|nr:hypothetical protein LTR13_011353 [Exophiala sideris]KAK5176088.1 hypothetical protein LTR44_011363 [Eurotiomycetes sp. CCFEE 6388]